MSDDVKRQFDEILNEPPLLEQLDLMDATITQLRADLDAANERAEKLAACLPADPYDDDVPVIACTAIALMRKTLQGEDVDPTIATVGAVQAQNERLRADLAAANERAEKAEREREEWLEEMGRCTLAAPFGYRGYPLHKGIARLRSDHDAARADAAALRAALKDTTRALEEMTDDEWLGDIDKKAVALAVHRARAALAPSAPDEGAK